MKESSATLLSFDDVAIVPDYFEGNSRDDVDLSTEICGVKLKIPFISAPMSSITEGHFAVAIGKQGGIGFIHRMMSVNAQINEICWVKENNVPVGASIGISNEDFKNINVFLEYGADLICLDIAHADQRAAIEFVYNAKKEYGDFPFVIGSIATSDAAERFMAALDPTINRNVALRASIAGGSMCETKSRAGALVPTFAACNSIKSVLPASWQLIADGGHRSSADCVKSLLFADGVMLGNLFAGTDETPGDVYVDVHGEKFKKYYGSASKIQKDLMNKSGYIEGKETLAPLKGPIDNVIRDLCYGIRSGLSYGGSLSIKEFQRKGKFAMVSSAIYF